MGKKKKIKTKEDLQQQQQHNMCHPQVVQFGANIQNRTNHSTT
jgi:hypothetical protein